MGPWPHAVVDVIFNLGKEEPPGTGRGYERSDLREHRHQLAESLELMADGIHVLVVLQPP